MEELVDHPNHYNKSNRKECIEEIKEYYGNDVVWYFCLTSAYKYLYRAGNKTGNTKTQDLAKAKWYINYAENIKTIYSEKLYTYVKQWLKELENDKN